MYGTHCMCVCERVSSCVNVAPACTLSRVNVKPLPNCMNIHGCCTCVDRHECFVNNMHSYICIYTYIRVHIYVYIYMYIHINMYKWTRVSSESLVTCGMGWLRLVGLFYRILSLLYGSCEKQTWNLTKATPY